MKCQPSWGLYCITMLLLANGLNAEEKPTFQKVVLTDKYYCDGINTGDFNRDGKPDIVAGPYWYAGPRVPSPRCSST